MFNETSSTSTTLDESAEKGLTVVTKPAPSKAAKDPDVPELDLSGPGMEGEIIPPSKGGKKVVALSGIKNTAEPAASNYAQFASVADRIRSRTRRGVLLLVENGRDLMDVKKKIGHGRFGDWLNREFGWSERTAQNYMNAATAFDELEKRGCVPEAMAFIPPTALYNFDKQSDEYKDKLVKAVKSGTIKVVNGKKPPKATTSSNVSATVPTSTKKDRDAAEELAKLIADELSITTRKKIKSDPGFNSPAFGELLNKAITASFGVPSSGGAA